MDKRVSYRYDEPWLVFCEVRFALGNRSSSAGLYVQIHLETCLGLLCVIVLERLSKSIFAVSQHTGRGMC